jgi:hypothetical protein
MDEMDENVLYVILNFDLFRNFHHIYDNEMMLLEEQQNISEYENYIVYQQ